MFCSEFAKRNPFLLAFFVPIGVVIVDRLFFDGVVSDLLVINRTLWFSDYSMWPLVSGLALSSIFIVLATMKRRQRI